jgi:hypothetical protein
MLLCGFSVDTTLTGTVGNGGSDEVLSVESNGQPNVTMQGPGCGTAAEWNADWTIDSPLNYTITA